MNAQDIAKMAAENAVLAQQYVKPCISLQDLKAKVASGELTKLHTSKIRVYVSRKSGSYVRPYSGKFGVGFALLSPNWKSSRYSYITYYIS